MHEGVYIALAVVGISVVGFFLYEQEQITQALLAKSLQPQSGGILADIGNILKGVGPVIGALL
jgi:hypothetical protein